jgi:hypothetical protein
LVARKEVPQFSQATYPQRQAAAIASNRRMAPVGERNFALIIGKSVVSPQTKKRDEVYCIFFLFA